MDPVYVVFGVRLWCLTRQSMAPVAGRGAGEVLYILVGLSHLKAST
jgi:hypothetical protein